jgi:hypothetical protein
MRRPAPTPSIFLKIDPATPAEVLLHDPVHDCLVATLELERHGQRDVTLLVERARVVAELHVLAINGLSSAVVRQQLRRLEDLGDEHRSLAFWCRGKKMQILPYRSAHGAGNSDVMLETGPATLDGLRDQP